MSVLRAAHTRAGSRQPNTYRLIRPVTLLLALLLAWGAAVAQQPPTIALGSYSYKVGETLTFSAANLAPNTNYQLKLQPPSDDAEARTANLRSNANGQLRYSAVVQDAGTYVLSISGPRIDASLNIPVTGAPAAPPARDSGQEPAEEPAPEQTEEPADEPAGTPETEPTPDDRGASSDESTSEQGANVAPNTEPNGRTSPQQSEEQSEVQSEEQSEGERGERDEEPAEEPGQQFGARTDGEPSMPPADAGTIEESPSARDPATAPGTGPQTGTPQTGTPEAGTPQTGTPQTGLGSVARAGSVTTPVGTVRIDGSAVVAGDPSTNGWRLDFPEDSGVTAGVALSGDRLLVGHGNSVLTIDPKTGAVRSRARLPAQVTDIAFSGSVALVSVRYASGAEQQVRLLSNGPEQLLPFDPDVELYSWLRNEAQVADPAARLEQDPTNPFLYLAAAQGSQGEDEQRSSGNSAEKRLEQALDHAVTFYERAQLAESFLTFDQPRQDLAASAMDGALHDFVARGYRPELLTDQALADAYGFPLKRLLSSLGRGNLSQAGFWADWVYRIATPEVPETQEALREYARYLQDNGQRDDASLWRKRASEGGGFKIAATLEDAARSAGRTGWYGVAALLVAIVAMHLTMLAKYWRPQTLQLKRRRAAGKSVSGFSRIYFMHYATFIEKLVVVLLFAAALALIALQGWATTGDTVPASWGSGSLATPAALESVAALNAENADALFVSGYALQSAGNTAAAEEAYKQLPESAAALNNLGVLEQDASLYQRALELQPRLPSAAFNLGEESNPSMLMTLYQPDKPALVVPDQQQLRGALAGSYLAAWGSAFTNPWATLSEVPGVTIAHWLWLVLVVLFLLWALVSILSLFWWQPRLARNAPRTFVYHLLALLLPGTGQADEFWGVFLSVPWAIFGVDLLLHYLPSWPDPAIALRTDIIALVVIYALNLLAFIVEFSSYRRRMDKLKRDDPAAARDYGMRIPAAKVA